MKYLITIIISVVVSQVAQAQERVHQSLQKSFRDNGQTLQISISGTSGNKTLDYHQTFNIYGWSKAQKDALVKRVTDSLGIDNAQPPKPPAPPRPPRANGGSSIDSDINDNGQTLRIRFSGISKNKSFTYNRVFDVKGMSKQQKDALIRRVTDSLGISNNVQLGTN